MALLSYRYWNITYFRWTAPLVTIVVIAVFEVFSRTATRNRVVQEQLALASLLPAQSPTPLFRFDTDNRIEYVNRAGQRHLTDLGSTDAGVAPTFWIKPLQRAAAMQQVVRHVYDVPVTGQTFSALFVPVQAPGDKGRPRVNVYVFDETERRQAEQTARTNQDFLRSVLDANPNFIFVKDFRHRYVMVNQPLADFYGVTKDEMIGKRFDEITRDTAAAAQAEAQDQAIFAGEERASLLGMPLTDKDNHVHWFHIVRRAITIEGEQGVERYLIGAALDVSDRLAAEAALAEEHGLLRTIMDHIPGYVYIKDRESRIVTANAAHVHLLGAESLDDIVGKTDFDFYPDATTAPFYAAEQEIMRTETPIIGRAVSGYHNGEQRSLWLLESKLPLYDADGNVKGLVGISSDITELKQTEQELTRAKDAAETATRQVRVPGQHEP
ncbi:MAG: PAS domain-containing protein [Caldilineaceae bacterium]